jgi:hypothetical protein
MSRIAAGSTSPGRHQRISKQVRHGCGRAVPLRPVRAGPQEPGAQARGRGGAAAAQGDGPVAAAGPLGRRGPVPRGAAGRAVARRGGDRAVLEAAALQAAGGPGRSRRRGEDDARPRAAMGASRVRAGRAGRGGPAGGARRVRGAGRRSGRAAAGAPAGAARHRAGDRRGRKDAPGAALLPPRAPALARRVLVLRSVRGAQRAGAGPGGGGGAGGGAGRRAGGGP